MFFQTGRGSFDDSSDYSILVALFAGGVTATIILIVGISLTLYRRNYSPQSLKVQTHVIHRYEGSGQASSLPNSNNKDMASGREVSACNNKTSMMEQLTPEDDPDVIPNKTERMPDIFEPDYVVADGEYEAIVAGDMRIYQNGCVERPAEELSPQRPRTLPVHRTHDIYTRRLPVQESCI